MTGYEGQQFGNYRLMGLLGQGIYADVYLGVHVYLRTLAAIKVLRARLTGTNQRRFLTEARIIAQLDHPHIVRVLDFGIEQGIPFLVMDYASGGSLRQNYPQGTSIELPRILSFTRQLAGALQYAHDQQIIHRDIKPENILLKKSYEVLLSDFGIAIMKRGTSSTLQAWDAFGTTHYAAPEQLQRTALTASDQYALGVVVYEWLTGDIPFHGSSKAEIVNQHIHAFPTLIHERAPGVLPAIEQVVLRALAKDPAARFPSVLAFAEALEKAAITSEKRRARDRRTDSASASAELTSVNLAPSQAQQIPLWNVPYHRNPYFTGRENVLKWLHDTLHSDQVAALTQPRVISGLGGIGKTQTAVEYAYRHANDYHAVLWARADTRETLSSDLLELARLLDLPEKDEQDASRITAAVKGWLARTPGWLLIFDNVEDLAMIVEFLPEEGRQHILMTTRTQVTGSLAQRIDLEEMYTEEGALFLLRRAGVVAQNASYADIPSTLRADAREISEMLDGLPLALEQAAAYIEKTGCSLLAYLDSYRSRRTELLRWHGGARRDHPEPVATTWSLSFEKVKQANRAAADLLRFCAFLAPDVIPEEIITQGAPDLGPVLGPVAGDPIELAEAYLELRKFSLLRRDAQAKTLSVHRLVQAVLKDNMNQAEQREWGERVVRAVCRTFPDSENVALWQRAERCLPQVHTCLVLLEEWHLVFPEAARLFNQAGMFLLEHAQYSLAELFLQKAVAIRTLLVGGEHPDLADSLNDLGAVYVFQGLYARAEPLLRRALIIHEGKHGEIHPDVAIATNNVALLAYYQGKYDEAEPLFLRALSIWKQLQGPEHPDVARTLNNLALLYSAQDRHTEAEPLYQQALAIWESVLGPGHPDAARTLNNLAKLYSKQGKYTEAEPLFLKARTIREKTLGPDHPDVAQTLSDLAHLYTEQGRCIEAEPLYQLALDIREQALGAEHNSVADLLEDYTLLLRKMERAVEAEKLTVQALAIRSRHSRQ